MVRKVRMNAKALSYAYIMPIGRTQGGFFNIDNGRIRTVNSAGGANVTVDHKGNDHFYATIATSLQNNRRLNKANDHFLRRYHSILYYRVLILLDYSTMKTPVHVATTVTVYVLRHIVSSRTILYAEEKISVHTPSSLHHRINVPTHDVQIRYNSYHLYDVS